MNRLEEVTKERDALKARIVERDGELADTYAERLRETARADKAEAKVQELQAVLASVRKSWEKERADRDAARVAYIEAMELHGHLRLRIRELERQCDRGTPNGTGVQEDAVDVSDRGGTNQGPQGAPGGPPKGTG